ncbi:DUF1214 domain-containing protein [Thalassotalea psychrophila]|uniref:DUF1214 domain-containing protein n=1 Tax=Thalassotalea psychrophila TaxID=3065647 RepID=A0ABY9TYZ4_9GAMM|nr:DUF1214 domain-containing protein [Colwelliaceae bacterium SQ149]
MKKLRLLSAVVLGLGISSVVAAAEYEAKVPKQITTPDIVETQTLGKLTFTDGIPDKETQIKAREDLFMTRAKTAFLNGIPAASTEAIFEGLQNAGVKTNAIGITENNLDARQLWLTPNTTSYYAFSPLLVEEPTFIEVPAGVLGFIDDAYMQYVTDVGALGEEQGKGATYLIVPKGWKGKLPKGDHFIRYAKTKTNWFLIRGLSIKGMTPEQVIANMKKTNIYTVSEGKNKETFTNLSGKDMNTIHANNYEFYEEMNRLVQREDVGALGDDLTGTLASIGIVKGKEFSPTNREKELLAESAAIANAQARTLAFFPTDQGIYKWGGDNLWDFPFGHKNHDFKVNGTVIQDDRTRFHYIATGITPAMVNKGGIVKTAAGDIDMLGKGSDYIHTARDENGDALTGDHVYEITVPAGEFSGAFWSFMPYSGQTRSGLETDSKKIGINSLKEGLEINKDGSVTIIFSAIKPKHTDNWVQTVKGKSFNILFRNYSPLKSWFDGSWELGNFKKIN